MPLFEYECQDCTHRFEVLASASGKKAKVCPKCGSKRTVKQLSAFSAASAHPTSSSTPSCPTGTCPFA